jgi:hypothetical protein
VQALPSSQLAADVQQPATGGFEQVLVEKSQMSLVQV